MFLFNGVSIKIHRNIVAYCLLKFVLYIWNRSIAQPDSSGKIDWVGTCWSTTWRRGSSAHFATTLVAWV